jgi:hypothetical protein
VSDVRNEPLFPASLEVVSTKHPGSGAPLVGLVMAQRIATLTSRESVEEHISRVRAAADAAWPKTTDELLEDDASGLHRDVIGAAVRERARALNVEGRFREAEDLMRGHLKASG